MNVALRAANNLFVSEQRAYTAAFLAFAPHVVGFCDGGLSPDRQAGMAAVVSLAL
jgi:hypothetical protein